MANNEAKKAAAKAEYMRQVDAGEKINLSGLAKETGVNRTTLHRWIVREEWGDAPRQPAGAPAGSRNAAGNHGGAPLGNKNAEKDGAYSAIRFDELTDRERQLWALTPLESLPALQNEMRILKLREARVLDALARYESEDEETLHLSSLMDMRSPGGAGSDGAIQTMGMYSSDTAFNRAMKLNEALYKIQGRIVTTINAMHAIEEATARAELERERLAIMKMRATGVIELDDEAEAL